MVDDLWPPQPFDTAYARYREHDAWWKGDTSALQEIYRGGQQPTHTRAGVAHAGGIVGRLSKMFWGAPIVAGEARSKTHLPTAEDICQLSADLVFGEAPTFRFPKPDDWKPKETGEKYEHPQQQRLTQIMGSDETRAELLTAGQMGAALGDSYLAVVWDKDLLDRVWLKAYAADCAIPEFRYGRLVKCTLWSEYRRAGESSVYRLLEIHTRGLIEYRLHRGSENVLGEAVSLDSIPETVHYEGFRAQAEHDAAIETALPLPKSVKVSTGVDRLAVVRLPNRDPNQEYRKLGVLANLGKSDLDGIEDLLDNIDQVASSLMRDVELGGARLTVPESWLERKDPGEGSTFDPNRQIYVGMQVLGKSDDSLSAQVHESQPDIRVETHQRAIDFWTTKIASNLGYSPAHLGVKDDVVGVRTATEVTADFSDSGRTRDKKILLVKPALAEIALVALAIDAKVFPGGTTPALGEMPDVIFPAMAQEDMEKIGRVVQSGYLSESMSRRERVRAFHPDWDDDEIDAEVEEVVKEFGREAPDPASFTDDPRTPTGERPTQIVE